MKKLILLSSLILFTTTLFSQNRCGTTEYQQQIEQINPEIRAERLKLEKDILRWIGENPNHQQKVIITIPVVVHVVYNSPQQNISDAQVQSQIDVLNNDFRRTNVDAIMTPTVWTSVAADCEIEFCLASTDPNGNSTNGITRTQTTSSSFSMQGDPVKDAANGGKDAWPNADYLNIWVCNLGSGLLGYATPPFGGIGQNDGVVIGYSYFGTIGTVQNPYNKGRTATHEVGHWLNLEHLWGGGFGNCGNDNVNDTPTQEEENYGCPAFPHNASSCNTTNTDGDMFMNYMDYTNDACMNMFTQGQKTRMIAAINQSRQNLLNHNLCGSAPPPPPCAPISPPITEDFQSATIPTNWSINNSDNDKTWEITSTAGFNSSSSIYINNADYSANGEVDDLILSPMDLTSLNNINLSFDYAYALWTDPTASPNYSDTLQILVSADCGSTWQKIWEKSGLNLVTTTPVFTAAAWTPSSNNDWNSEIINLDNYTVEDDFMLKFRNINDYENNLFLDNINISATVISTLNEINTTEKILIKIVDVLGREVKNPKQFNKTLFYIYDNGVVEKKIIID
ncbi:MAG: zinc metalloprotease [Flavobacteriales bacterium]|nr:zinc metalloprotease [Flavobacteriales bacterium]